MTDKVIDVDLNYSDVRLETYAPGLVRAHFTVTPEASSPIDENVKSVSYIIREPKFLSMNGNNNIMELPNIFKFNPLTDADPETYTLGSYSNGAIAWHFTKLPLGQPIKFSIFYSHPSF